MKQTWNIFGSPVVPHSNGKRQAFFFFAFRNGLLLLLLLLPCLSLQAKESMELQPVPDTIYLSATEFNRLESGLQPANDSIPEPVNKADLRKRKFVAAIMALPFPFGIVGAHRVMMGTAPWVPIVYIATFGGCFGLLPLIDFCAIVFSKDFEQYENNEQVFMWVK